MDHMLQEWKVRKIEWLISETLREGEVEVVPAAQKVAALIVLQNPALAAASDDEGMRLLAAAAAGIGVAIMPRLTSLMAGPTLSYGKAAIVGTSGEIEHGAGLIHPTLGKPIREAIGGGSALIPSNTKVAAAGASIDVPLGHRNDPWSFNEIDTMTVTCADAPRPDEIMLVIALATGGRPRARVKKA